MIARHPAIIVTNTYLRDISSAQWLCNSSKSGEKIRKSRFIDSATNRRIGSYGVEDTLCQSVVLKQ